MAGWANQPARELIFLIALQASNMKDALRRNRYTPHCVMTSTAQIHEGVPSWIADSPAASVICIEQEQATRRMNASHRHLIFPKQ
mmetsp:Transcript_57064/g.102619  ORF Transcript_57064/g.102619 Transcript_57064/m.102619 type:complete len:85 (+) Transcript_57064:239-493(+)